MPAQPGRSRPRPQAPRVSVLRGTAWARLLDDFVARGASDPDVWSDDPLTACLAEEVLQETARSPHPAHLPPSTLLGALHRRPDAVVPDLHALLRLEGDWWRALARLPHGLGAACLAARDTTGSSVRAWPVCLRSAAVRHVHDRLRRGMLVPRTTGILRAVGRLPPDTPRETALDALTDWLDQLRCGGGDGGPDADVRRHGVRRLLAKNLVAGDPDPVARAAWERDALEHDEAALVGDAVGRYGPVSPADEQRLAHHLDQLGHLVLEASRHGRDHWTAEQRDAYDHRPDVAQRTVLQDQLLCSPEDYLRSCASRLTDLVHDPLADPHAIETLTGDSHLRPATLYPDLAPADDAA